MIFQIIHVFNIKLIISFFEYELCSCSPTYQRNTTVAVLIRGSIDLHCRFYVFSYLWTSEFNAGLVSRQVFRLKVLSLNIQCMFRD